MQNKKKDRFDQLLQAMVFSTCTRGNARKRSSNIKAGCFRKLW
jgi:hypothetical protein